MRIAEELGYHYYDQPYDEDEPFANQALWANAMVGRIVEVNVERVHRAAVDADLDVEVVGGRALDRVAAE
jgi:hypothetical protein